MRLLVIYKKTYGPNKEFTEASFMDIKGSLNNIGGMQSILRAIRTFFTIFRAITGAS